MKRIPVNVLPIAGIVASSPKGAAASSSGSDDERTDRSVRTNVGTLVTLYTVVLVPFGNECGNTALLILGSTLSPSTVSIVDECRYGQKVAVLSVDGANHLVDEFGVVVGNHCIIGK